jgi:small subunit ribosomal protein S11
MGKKKIQTAKSDDVKKKASRVKISRKFRRGRAYVSSTYNNTIVTVTNETGDVVTSASSGALGFKGAKKSTPYAATMIIKELSERLESTGLREIDIYVRGVGSGRDAAIRALATQGLEINSIRDITPVPHNGCRHKKPRRV